jgi:chitodextrinase
MRRVQIVILSLVLMFGWSCRKKTYPESITENEAVYYSNFTVDGKPVQIRAGINEYYMYSDLNQDTSGLYSFNSQLRQSGCTSSCPVSIEIQINDFKTSSAGAPVLIDSTLQLKRYQYVVAGGGASYFASFSAAFNKPVSSTGYHWTFGDGTEYFGNSPYHVYKNAGTYQVCVSARSGGGCVSNSCSMLKVGTAKFNAGITAQATSGDTVTFSSARLNGVAPFKYLWNFGDGTSSTLANPLHVYPYTGAYQASLRMIDDNKDTSYSYYNVVTKKDISSCAVNYALNSMGAVAGSDKWSKVIITWNDENGNPFTSSTAPQPSSSFFEIVSVTEGSRNEKGFATKKVQVRFSCKVFGAGRTVDISNGETTIAVPYK